MRDVNIDIPHGERRALIGPNGAGKTTLFNLIAGDLPVSTGRIFVFDQEVTNMPPHQRVKLGLRRTYQTSALFNKLTVSQNLYLGVLGPGGGKKHFDIFNIAESDISRMDLVYEVADSVGLSEQLSVKTSDLGHGQRRQLEVGLALAWNPRLIMLDEPAAGLSAEERGVVVSLINKLERSVSVLLIEHDMEVALKIGERVTVLHEGSIIAEGTPSEISSNSLVQQVYLGGHLHV